MNYNGKCHIIFVLFNNWIRIEMMKKFLFILVIFADYKMGWYKLMFLLYFTPSSWSK